MSFSPPTIHRQLTPAGANVTLSELNPAGTELLYSTYLGGSRIPEISARVWLWIARAMPMSPAIPTPPISPSPPAPSKAQIKLRPAGARKPPLPPRSIPPQRALIYSTFLGGSSGDDAYGLALDSSGDLYLTGSTLSRDFPVTGNAFQPANAAASGSTNAFLTELNPDRHHSIPPTWEECEVDDSGYQVALATGPRICRVPPVLQIFRSPPTLSKPHITPPTTLHL